MRSRNGSVNYQSNNLKNRIKMESIVNVLVKRDGVWKKEAEQRVAEVRDMILNGEIDPWEIDDVMMDEFGLEPDYIEDLLGF